MFANTSLGNPVAGSISTLTAHGPVPVVGNGTTCWNPPWHMIIPFWSEHGLHPEQPPDFLRMSLMKQFLIGLMTITCCASCGSKTKPHSVSARSIIESFRIVPESADRQYVGQLLSISVRADQSTVNGKKIFLSVVNGQPHAIEFVFIDDIPMFTRANIVGVCEGCTRDGIDRGMGIDFVIVFSKCRIE